MHKIVLISGKQGSGKTTLADGLSFRALECGYRPIRTRFAASLYAIHDAARDKAREIGVNYPDKFGELLQVLGTELGRNYFGEDIWVNALKTYIEKTIATRFDLDAQPDARPLCFIIDDARFENELDAFDGSNVYKIRLNADKNSRRSRCSYWRENDQHPSEIGLDMYASRGKFDLYVGTDGAMDANETLEVVASMVFK